MSAEDQTADGRLHRALVAGIPGARRRFYLQYVDVVVRWCTRLGGRGIDSEDAAHEVFIVALDKLDRFRPGSFEAWLYAITRRVLANHRRRARTRQVWTRIFGAQFERTRPADAGPLTESVNHERRRMVFECLEVLSVKHREVLVLCEMEGRTAVEVSGMLGVPQGTVYTRLHYAKKAFRKASLTTGLLDALDRPGSQDRAEQDAEGRAGGERP